MLIAVNWLYADNPVIKAVGTSTKTLMICIQWRYQMARCLFPVNIASMHHDTIAYCQSIVSFIHNTVNHLFSMIIHSYDNIDIPYV